MTPVVPRSLGMVESVPRVDDRFALDRTIYGDLDIEIDEFEAPGKSFRHCPFSLN